MASVRVENLKKIFRRGKIEVRAVDGITITIPDGQAFGVLGPSGHGKTTFLRLIAGLEVPTDGTIYFDDELVSAPGRIVVEPEHRGIAMVFQLWALYPNMTVYDNIAFPLRNAKVPKSEIDKKVKEIAEELGLTKVLNHYPRELSGGQMQRTAIARALVKNPRLLLMDEPFSNLDAAVRDSARALVRKIQRERKLTTIIVSHDPADIFSIAEVAGVIINGKFAQVSSPTDIYDNPANEVVAKLGGDINIVNVTVSGGFIYLSSSVKVPSPNPKLEGKYRLGVRPEDVMLSDSTDAPGMTFAGKVKVKVSSYVAGVFRTVVSPIDDDSVELMVNMGGYVEPGSEKNLLIRTQKIKLFDENGENVTLSALKTNS
ncbi:Arabinose ABC transporter, ATP-binding protein [Acidilobus saccharovorans 345-15]|uniref:Arabinose ABC transporter, ATP-binding protein n=1 Tax=Acidilobus saccharovorans (strain DSM 16705 / JCM 18335 / VKM B-2471 / 345-15) TaxID=666510 RepID=D9Q251_ACIS3|nr:glucose ABC transporter ATP-binding protein GlcV [Acidilobus saccharovorans]ADL19389.1 Arabinose ABC transporter, ATP-binding protein [Acidilobus saccharovorans 345-15]